MNDDLTPQPDRVSERWWDERAEAFEAWADRVSPADLEPADTSALQAITKLTDLRREIDAAILEAVREARRQRRTWAEIGAMLGVSKQAAQHKYGPLLADSQPDASEPPIGDPGERLAADRRLIEAYRRLPEDPALIESAARLAARTDELVGSLDVEPDDDIDAVIYGLGT